MRSAVILLFAILLASPALATGFQYGSAPDGGNPPLELAIWYPSDAPVSVQSLGLFTQDVAPYGAVKDGPLPLVVISHGTGGGASSHYDTALALAEAGFVVVAMTHTGDNYKDGAASFTLANFANRPRHVARVIDFMLTGWSGHDRIDPARIGIFGFSAGGGTALVALGATPDPALAIKFCEEHADSWGCQRAKEHGGIPPTDTVSLQWPHEPRLKAAAIAAPALVPAFPKAELAAIAAPVQLWRAEGDTITPNQWYGDVVRDALAKPPDDHFVPQAGHYDFLAPCSEALAKIAPEICASAPGFDRAAFHRDLDQALVAFFKAQLALP